MHSLRLIALLLLTATFALAEVKDEHKQKITDAAPAEPIVKTDSPRKLLVFSRTTGFRHGSIPVGIEALRIMGEKTGAYTIDATEDPAVFTDENLRQYDAIVMLNTTGDPIPEASQRTAFEKFVTSGKGLIGIHSATDTGYNWETYGKMMGGYFAGHPWGAGDTVHIRIEDPDHATCKHFGSDELVHKDEIYQYKEKPYSRDHLRVLMSLDLSKPGMKKNNMKRKDNDYAVGWVQSFEGGRVFYSNLGHNHHTYWTGPILKHFLAGIQFACGDLKADTTPSNK